MTQSQDLQAILKSAKQRGLISHTHAAAFGQNHTGANEPDEPINQTLSGIVTVLIIIVIILSALLATYYFFI